MPPLDFPSPATPGQVFDAWVFDGSKWTSGVGSGVAYLPLAGGSVTGATTFSAAGTGLAVSNNATVGGISQSNYVAAPAVAGANRVWSNTDGAAVGTSLFYGNGTTSGTLGNVGDAAQYYFCNTNNSIDSTGNPGNSWYQAIFQMNQGACRGGQGVVRITQTSVAPTADTGQFFWEGLNVGIVLNHAAGNASGSAIAYSGGISMNAGGTNWGLVEAMELGLSRVAGSAVQQAVLLNLIWTNQAGHASVQESVVNFASVPGDATGANAIFSIGRRGDQWILDQTNGWVLTTNPQINNNPGNAQRKAQAAAGGFDFSKVNFSTAALRAPGVSVGGAHLAQIGSALYSVDANGLVLDVTGTQAFVTGVNAGGSFYQVNDQLYDGLGGILLVSAVSSGAVTTANYIAGKEPYFFGTGPATVTTTGGSGSGCVLNVAWASRSQLTINKSGSNTVIGGPATVGGNLSVSGGATITAALNANGALYLPQVADSANNSFAQHISLYGAQYGIGVTGGRLNLVGPGAGAGVFFVNQSDNTDNASITESGISMPVLQASATYANDAAAAAGGVPVGRLYRNGSVVQIRVA